VAGLALYAGFTILTGIEIGYVSVAVGWLVGKAIRIGSGGIGGRRYQIAALLLTYAAVSMASIPILIHYIVTHKPAQTQTRKSETTPSPSDAGSSSQDPDQKPTDQPAASRPSLAGLAGQLVLWGLASPFLQLQSGFRGIIGIIILLVGMQFAWKLTGGPPKIVIDGPFDNSKSLRT